MTNENGGSGGGDGGELSLSPDIIFRIGPGGEILVYQVRARAHVELCSGALSMLRAAAAGATATELAEAAGGPVRLRTVTCEGTVDGLFSDPTNLDAARLQEPLAETEARAPAEALRWLVDQLILVRDIADYRERFELKLSDDDAHHLGNYYQHLTERLTAEAAEPEQWWLEQKFEAGAQRLRESTLYEHVQYRYLRESFPLPTSLEGRRVLDFGCGPGYYSGFFADRGADVLGLDPSAAHLEVARQRFESPTCRFRRLRLRGGKILPFASGSFDLIWISDTLLFYFTLPHLQPIRKALLRRLRVLLKPDGDLVVMDPHGAFWLAPWFGDAEDPFTVITEYGPSTADRRFRVTPTLSELVDALTSAGFALRRLDEPIPDEAYAAINPRAYEFARRFPLWWVVWATVPQSG